MVDALQPLSGSPILPVAPTQRASRREPVAPLPATPPADLGPELDAAAAAADAFERQGIAVHFDTSGGALRIQMLSGDGSLLREVSPAHLLDTLAAGGNGGLVVDETG